MFLKDAVQLLGATSLEATKFAEEVFHFEKRIAELTPNTEDIINPVKSVQILNVADLQRQSFSVHFETSWFYTRPRGCKHSRDELLILLIPLERFNFFFSSSLAICLFVQYQAIPSFSSLFF